MRIRGGCSGGHARVVETPCPDEEAEHLRKLALSKSPEDSPWPFPKYYKNGSANTQHRSKFNVGPNGGVENMTDQNIDYWRKLAEGGNAKAMYNLGLCYYKGIAVAKNYEQAYDYFFKSAENGYADAKHNLAICCQLGRGIPASQVAAKEWYIEAAEANVSESMNNLGQMYQKGIGCDVDEKEAFKWFKKGADLANGDAMYNLGLCYYHGNGTRQNLTEALEWFQACAIASGEAKPKAEYLLGAMHFHGKGMPELDYKESLFWYRRSADHGYPPAQLQIGKLLVGTPKTPTKSPQAMVEGVRYLQMAAKNGEAEAYNMLGYIYSTGKLGKPDNEKSFECYSKAVDLGWGPSVPFLAHAYQFGLGTEKDIDKAIPLHERAARAGYSASMNALGGLYHDGTEVDRDFETALSWFEKAGDHGEAGAQFQCAIHKMYGMGCEANLREAKEWLEKAASQKHAESIRLLNEHFGGWPPPRPPDD
eukprot:CAMPEP_0167779704 /NCGR_PEP_ID=MMETSP0111_2-20121227/4952_1 /TAXON_ID=91324 /ORGANISM="Lotharella globosa, Strain CCCM811" /LENGTH=477 /DNA_ID=CAMNT_0007670139 /DNA_START=227 /DNA_END=1660 /DNA_ORIENTATION=-